MLAFCEALVKPASGRVGRHPALLSGTGEGGPFRFRLWRRSDVPIRGRYGKEGRKEGSLRSVRIQTRARTRARRSVPGEFSTEFSTELSTTLDRKCLVVSLVSPTIAQELANELLACGVEVTFPERRAALAARLAATGCKVAIVRELAQVARKRARSSPAGLLWSWLDRGTWVAVLAGLHAERGTLDPRRLEDNARLAAEDEAAGMTIEESARRRLWTATIVVSLRAAWRDTYSPEALRRRLAGQNPSRSPSPDTCRPEPLARRWPGW